MRILPTGLLAGAPLAVLMGCTMTAPVPDPMTGGDQPPTLAALAGRYDVNAAACARPGEMRMTIAADRVDFYESRCQLVSETTGGGVVRAHMQCTGEGETRFTDYAFTPVQGGVTVTGNGVATTRIRCN